MKNGSNETKSPAVRRKPRPSWVIEPQKRSNGGQQATAALPKRKVSTVLVGVAVFLLVGIVGVFVLTTRQEAKDVLQLYLQSQQALEQNDFPAALRLIKQAQQKAESPTSQKTFVELEIKIKLRQAEVLLAQKQLLAAKRLLTQLPADQAGQRAKALLAQIDQELSSTKKATESSKGAGKGTKITTTKLLTSPTQDQETAPDRDSTAVPETPRSVQPAGTLNTKASKRVEPHAGRRWKSRRHRALPPPGTVMVNSPVPSKIFIDGDDSGKVTPATITLPPGSYEIVTTSLQDSSRKKTSTARVTSGGALQLNMTYPEPPKLVVAPDAGLPKLAVRPSPPPVTPRAAQARGTGYLSISSRISGTVYIDSNSTGKLTPLWMYKLPAGKHVIEIRGSDGKTIKTATIDVVDKQVSPLLFK